MATVYHCANILSPRIRGAIKIVDPGQHQGIRARFIREVEALARLRHHAVIRVLTSGQDLRRGLLYMVMELIEGEDLLQILKRGPLPWPEICDSFRQIADGLRHAHVQGIHHRDIKPANVMLQEDGSAVIVDFGIALDQERSRLTRAGMVPGTVSYMAPEVLTGDPRVIEADRADVYSLGVVLYEALVGQRAFPMDNRGGQAAAMIRIIEKKHEIGPLDPGDVAPDRVRDMIRRCTELQPLQRPTMGQVVRLFDAARSEPAAIEAILGADTVTEEAQDFDPETSFPFALYRAGSLTAAEEETLVLDLMDNVDEGLRAAIDAELDRLPLDQHLTQPPIEALEPVHWQLDELTENARAITEDEEVGGVFDREALERQIRIEKRARLRQRTLLWITAFLAAAIIGGLVTAMGAILMLVWLWPG